MSNVEIVTNIDIASEIAHATVTEVLANMENERIGYVLIGVLQQLETIQDITDPIEQAKLYKKVFSDCCDIPQVGCSCSGDCHCNDTPTPPEEA